MKRIRIFVVTINGKVNTSVFRDLAAVARGMAMNYDSIKAKKRISGVQTFKGGLTITECYLMGSKRKGNINKFDPEYKQKKKLMGTVPATEEEQRMLNYKNDREIHEDI